MESVVYVCMIVTFSLLLLAVALVRSLSARRYPPRPLSRAANRSTVAVYHSGCPRPVRVPTPADIVSKLPCMKIDSSKQATTTCAICCCEDPQAEFKLLPCLHMYVCLHAVFCLHAV